MHPIDLTIKFKIRNFASWKWKVLKSRMNRKRRLSTEENGNLPVKKLAPGQCSPAPFFEKKLKIENFVRLTKEEAASPTCHSWDFRDFWIFTIFDKKKILIKERLGCTQTEFMTFFMPDTLDNWCRQSNYSPKFILLSAYVLMSWHTLWKVILLRSDIWFNLRN